MPFTPYDAYVHDSMSLTGSRAGIYETEISTLYSTDVWYTMILSPCSAVVDNQISSDTGVPEHGTSRNYSGYS